MTQAPTTRAADIVKAAVPAAVDDAVGCNVLRDALDAVERDAVSNSLAVQQQRPVLADRAKRFVQRFDDGDREPLTWFHSRVVADTTLSAVFASMAKRIRTFDAATGRAAVVLMRRFSDHTGLAITTFMVHRLFLAAMLVAAKAHHDLVVRNCDFARVVGLHRLEIERLELAFCVGVDWRTLVTAADDGDLTSCDESAIDRRCHDNQRTSIPPAVEHGSPHTTTSGVPNDSFMSRRGTDDDDEDADAPFLVSIEASSSAVLFYAATGAAHAPADGAQDALIALVPS
jgi:hypothetical protein